MKTNYSDDQKTLISLYALVGAGSIMMMIPFSLLPYAGLACAFVGLIAAYIYRFKNKTNLMMAYHCTYIIRTLWWSSLILIAGIVIFGSIIFLNGDMSSIHQLMLGAERGVVPSETDVLIMQYNFIQANKGLIYIAGIIGLLPYPAYLIYRTIKGVRQLVKKEG